MLVLAQHKVEIVVDNARDVVRRARVVKGGRRQERQVGRLPHIRVVQNGRQKQVEDDHDGKRVARDPEWCGERHTRVVDLRPVDADGKKAEPRVHAKDGVDFLVVRPYPRDKSKGARRRPDVIGEPEQHKGKQRKQRKEPVPRHCPPVGGRAVLRLMQRTKQHRRRQGGRPDERSRVDEPAARQAGQAKAQHLGGEQEEERKAGAVILAPVDGADDGDEGARCIGDARADVDANDNHGMLLDAKGARVDVEGESAQGQSPARKTLPCPADGEHEQLGHDVADGEGRVAKAKELVGARKDDDKHRRQDPCSECCSKLGR